VRKFFAPILFCFSFLATHAQQSPWNTIAPPGAITYTDLKTAEKNASVCYRLDLTAFDFYKDKKILPKMSSLTNVMGFMIGNNNLTELPSVFLQMHSLVFFQSSGNPLTTLSDSIGMWSELKFLNLYGTNFDTLPEGIYGCTKLYSMSIANNKDTLKITDAISSMSSLVELNIFSTVLDTLPIKFSGMKNLRRLSFYKTGLNEFPKQIVAMNELQELCLDSNTISSLPRVISEMSGLTYLSLRGNKIKHVTSSICFLKNLTTLDLRGNPIDPYEIKSLQALLPSCSILF
jgi:Leucine-rich repeat (LRR) protein